MQIHITNPKEDWILDRIRKEWYQYNPDTIPNDRPELTWLIAPWLWSQYDSSILKRTKVLTTIHHVVPGKFVESDFRYRDDVTNAYHVPNKFTKELIKYHTEKAIHVIPYWYDPAIWVPLDKTKCRRSLKLPDDKFVVGSFQRDTEGKDNITPKYEKGPDKFIEAIRQLKDRKDVLVLLGGWRRGYVISKLKEMNVPYIYIEKADMQTLKTMYGSLDLYISASRNEGGPQAVLEASAMKVPIISTNVGMASVVLGYNCIQNIPDEVRIPDEEDVIYNYKNVEKFNIENIKNVYLNMFEEIR